MNRQDYKIFSDGTLGGLTLKNRLVRSATCDYQANEDGSITPQILEIYRKLAMGGVGMIITGLLATTADSIGTKGQASIHNDDCALELSKLASVVHKADHNCRIIAQLCHPGRQITQEHTLSECVGPSAVASPLLVKKARELSEEEIYSIISNFANAIVRVQQAGFDGVQLHAAHGYLLSSFLSPYTNQRTDSYGGNVKNRVSIIRDIIHLARKTVGNFPILIKLNCDDHVPGGVDTESFPELAFEIARSGVDAIEVSGGIWDCLVRSEVELGFSPVPLPEARTHIDEPEKQSYYYDYVKELSLPVPIILVGGNRNIDHMETLLMEGHIDFLSLSRPLICEPDLPNRWLLGIGGARSSCASCNACILFKDDFSCALRRHHLNRTEFEIGFANGWRAAFQ